MTPKQRSRGWPSTTWKVIAGLGTVIALLVGARTLISSLIPHHPLPRAAFSSQGLGNFTQASKFITFLRNHEHKVVSLNITCPGWGRDGGCSPAKNDTINIIRYPSTNTGDYVEFNSNSGFSPAYPNGVTIQGDFLIKDMTSYGFKDYWYYHLSAQKGT